MSLGHVPGTTPAWTSPRAVRVIDEDPDLPHGLPATELERLRHRAVAAVIELDRGPVIETLPRIPSGSFGFLVLDGVLAAGMRLGSRLTLELLGPTDLIRPGAGRTLGAEDALGVDFAALTPTRLAVLDFAFACRVAGWPHLAAGVIARSVLRSRRLQYQAAVRALPRIDERILLTLWHYAERWGRMTSQGALLELRLTHSQLADIVGAQRPTVSTQLSRLMRDGLVERPDRSHWLLPGTPPPALWDLYEQAGLAATEPAPDQS